MDLRISLKIDLRMNLKMRPKKNWKKNKMKGHGQKEAHVLFSPQQAQLRNFYEKSEFPVEKQENDVCVWNPLRRSA